MGPITTNHINRKKWKAQEVAESIPESSVEVGQKRAIEVINMLETAEEIKQFVASTERTEVSKAAVERMRELNTLKRVRDDNNKTTSEKPAV